ncbi:putative ribonuclease H-like domain-containing protein [Tanacetum coccineum]
MLTLTFSNTHNMVAFLEKPAESDGFHEIINFLNANQIHYALTINPTIYTPCIEQFWATTKIKTVNGEHGTDCLPTATILEELARMGYEKPSQKLTVYKAFFSPQWKFLIHTITQCLSAKTTAWNEFSSTMASAIICLATNQKFNLSKYILMLWRKQKKTIVVSHPSDSTADVPNEGSVPTHSNDPLLNGEDRLKLTDLMDMFKKLEKKTGLRTHKFKRLYKVGVIRRVEYSNDESLGAQEDAFNQGVSIENIDKDAEVSLVDETQGRSDDAEMFDTDDLIGNEVFAENDMIEKDEDVIPKEVSTAAPSTTAMSPLVIIEVEITLAQTLAKLKSEKSKVMIQELVKSTATTTPLIIPKAKGITFRDAGESTTRTPTSVSSSSIKDKGKAKMDEPEVPLNKKEQISLDEEIARNLKAQIQAELIEEERLARKKEAEANIALIESCDNIQAMIEVDFELAQRLQAKEHGEIIIEERSRLFDELESDKSKEAKSSKKKAEGGRKKSIGKKRVGKEQKQESSKRQRMEDDKETNEHKEAEKDDEAEMKKHMENTRNNGNQVKGRAFNVNAVGALQGPNVVTGTFSLNNHYATILFDSGADFSFISTDFAPLLNVKPSFVNPRYVIEVANGKKVEVDRIICDCKL